MTSWDSALGRTQQEHGSWTRAVRGAAKAVRDGDEASSWSHYDHSCIGGANTAQGRSGHCVCHNEDVSAPEGGERQGPGNMEIQERTTLRLKQAGLPGSDRRSAREHRLGREQRGPRTVPSPGLRNEYCLARDHGTSRRYARARDLPASRFRNEYSIAGDHPAGPPEAASPKSGPSQKRRRHPGWPRLHIVQAVLLVCLGYRVALPTYTAFHEAAHQVPLWLLGAQYQGYIRRDNCFNRYLIDHGWFDEAPRATWFEYRDARDALSEWEGPRTREYWRLRRTVSRFRCRGWVSWHSTKMQSAKTGFYAFARVLTSYMPYILASLLFALAAHLWMEVVRRWRREGRQSPVQLRVFYFLLPIAFHWMYVFYRTASRPNDGILANDIQKHSQWLNGYTVFGRALETNDVLRQCTSGFVILVGSIVMYVIVVTVAVLALRLGLFGLPRAGATLASRASETYSAPALQG